MVMSLQTHEWYVEGRQAYLNNVIINPYAADTEAHKWWQAGWEAAVEETERQLLHGKDRAQDQQ